MNDLILKAAKGNANARCAYPGQAPLEAALKQFETAFEISANDLAEAVERLRPATTNDSNDFLLAVLLDLHLSFSRAVRALRQALVADRQAGGGAAD